jgi:hypothetical protein
MGNCPDINKLPWWCQLIFGFMHVNGQALRKAFSECGVTDFFGSFNFFALASRVFSANMGCKILVAPTLVVLLHFIE